MKSESVLPHLQKPSFGP